MIVEQIFMFPSKKMAAKQVYLMKRVINNAYKMHEIIANVKLRYHFKY